MRVDRGGRRPPALARRRGARRAAALLSLLFAAPLAALCASGVGTGSGGPAIAFIIDDVGYRAEEAEVILALPAPVALAVLPGTPYATASATRAGAAGREVLLHQPMAPRDPARDPGPRALLPAMTAGELLATLDANLSELPGVDGVNGHMGSLLTTRPDAMREVMRLLRRRGSLFFVDSWTHPQSVALRQALLHGLPATRRNVFLDHDPAEAAVRAELDRLRAVARREGSALAIGHPGDVTLRLLAETIPQLREEGFRLVGISELIELQRQQRALPDAAAARHDGDPLSH